MKAPPFAAKVFFGGLLSSAVIVPFLVLRRGGGGNGAAATAGLGGERRLLLAYDPDEPACLHFLAGSSSGGPGPLRHLQSSEDPPAVPSGAAAALSATQVRRLVSPLILREALWGDGGGRGAAPASSEGGGAAGPRASTAGPSLESALQSAASHGFFDEEVFAEVAQFPGSAEGGETGRETATVRARWLRFVEMEEVRASGAEAARRAELAAMRNPCVKVVEFDQLQQLVLPTVEDAAEAEGGGASGARSLRNPPPRGAPLRRALAAERPPPLAGDGLRSATARRIGELRTGDAAAAAAATPAAATLSADPPLPSVAGRVGGVSEGAAPLGSGDRGSSGSAAGSAAGPAAGPATGSAAGFAAGSAAGSAAFVSSVNEGAASTEDASMDGNGASDNEFDFSTRPISSLPVLLRAAGPGERAVARGLQGVGPSVRGPSFGAPLVPNDPKFSLQWNLAVMDAAGGWRVREATGSGDGSAFTVAVLDTGCDLSHLELRNQLWRNEGEICGNGVDDDGNGYVDDCHGWNFFGNDNNLTEARVHGTPVAGAILAETGNEFGIASICPHCRLLCARVGEAGFSTAAFAEALNYALGFGVRVVNYSGNGAYSEIQAATLRSAARADVVFVGCAGNAGCHLDDDPRCARAEGYPSRLNLPFMLAVGASDERGAVAKYSNRGPRTVDVFAPSGILLPRPAGDQFKVVHGTSFSGPLVAAAAALIRSTFPTLSAEDTVRAIRRTCRIDAKKIAPNLAVCPGVVDVAAAMNAAADMARKGG